MTQDGIVALFFSIMPGRAEWNDDRGRYVYSSILELKDRIREKMQSNLGDISLYETIHMTDDMNEFKNDFSQLMMLICKSQCEYYSGDELLRLTFFPPKSENC